MERESYRYGLGERDRLDGNRGGPAGGWMNNRCQRACFVLWLVSNTRTFGIHTCASMWALAARDGAFLVMAIHGWWLWGAKLHK